MMRRRIPGAPLERLGAARFSSVWRSHGAIKLHGSNPPPRPSRDSLMPHAAQRFAVPVFLAFIPYAAAEDWPEYRGPTGQGLYAGKPLPIEWSTTKNVVWKEPIPGHGWSSPVVREGRIY